MPGMAVQRGILPQEHGFLRFWHLPWANHPHQHSMTGADVGDLPREDGVCAAAPSMYICTVWCRCLSVYIVFYILKVAVRGGVWADSADCC